MNETILEHGGARLAVAALGAEARRWRVGGVDLLWPGDPAVWPEISPLLFPVVGWTRDGARVAGKPYALGLHGFARRLTYTVERREADFARFVVRDDAETRAVYPFPFVFAAEYRLGARSLEIALEATNRGDAPMPYACGLHPGFNWPFGAANSRDGARIVFEAPEAPEVPVIAPGGLIGAAKRPIPLQGRVLPLDEALFANDAVSFLGVASRSLRFEQADGSALAMTLDDFPHIALWRRQGAPYLCLEAWTGYSDPHDFAGDLFEKPSMRLLAPGASARHAAVYSYEPGASA